MAQEKENVGRRFRSNRVGSEPRQGRIGIASTGFEDSGSHLQPGGGEAVDAQGLTQRRAVPRIGEGVEGSIGEAESAFN